MGFFSLGGQLNFFPRYFVAPISSNVVIIVGVDVGKNTKNGAKTPKRAKKWRKNPNMRSANKKVA